MVTYKEANMIHCVLKPEKNKDANDGDNVKLIDFRCVTIRLILTSNNAITETPRF